MDIITDGLLGGEVLDSTEYTCKAGFVSDEEEGEEIVEEVEV